MIRLVKNTLSFKCLQLKNGSVKPIFNYQIVISMLRYIFLQSLKKFWRGGGWGDSEPLEIFKFLNDPEPPTEFFILPGWHGLCDLYRYTVFTKLHCLAFFNPSMFCDNILNCLSLWAVWFQKYSTVKLQSR